MTKINKGNALLLAVQKDKDIFIATWQPITDRIFYAAKNKNYIESFLLSWSLLEQALLPSLIRQIAYELHFTDLPRLSDMSASQLIYTYYFISHDKKLYHHLISINKRRNQFVHEIAKFDMKHIDSEAKKLTTELLKKVILQALERLAGTTPIPVLNLYFEGWNDALSDVLKNVKHT